MRAWRGPTRSRGRVCLGTAALLGAWLAAPPLRAQVGPPPSPPPPASDPEGISLEALLDTVVWIASRRDERVSAAPGSITVYTEEDLRALGYYTIYDLANFTPGWSGSIVFGEKVLETRGQKAGSFNNNKHLVYVDGIPVAHARNHRAPVDEELPLFFARSVEFLRGPASAMYGTSAFFGVVNVVPGDLEHEGSDFGLRLSAGTRDVERRVGAQALVNDAAGSFRLALGYYEKNASHTPLPPPPGAATDPGNLFWDDQKSVFLNPTYTLRISPLRGLGIGVIYMRKSGGLGESWREGGSHRLNDLTWETAIPYLKYRRTLSERLAVDAYLFYNTGRETGLWSNFAGRPLTASDGAPLYGYDTQVDDIQGETQLSLSLGERTSVTAGVTVDTRRQRGSSRSYSYGVTGDSGAPFVLDQSLVLPSDRYTIYSVFAQLQHRLPVLAGLTLTLGAREDVGVSSHSTYQLLSPRAGLVQAITEALSLKAFYGTALRAPGIKEFGLNEESRLTLQRKLIPADDIPLDLEAEVIQSFELGPMFSSRRVSASLTGFRNRTKRALDGVEATIGGQAVNIFRNSEVDVTAVGVEAELQLVLGRDLRLLANYAWSRARGRRLVQQQLVPADVEDVPVQKLNAAVLYRLRAPLDARAAVIARWVDEYRVAGDGPRPQGALTVDANLVLALGRLLAPAVPVDLELQARNLLDRRPLLPKRGRPGVPLPGFSLLATLAYGY
jgi:outer membrane receptor for ferrienterochelin and colicins